METATLLDSDLQLPTQSLESETPQDPYSGLRKLAQSARALQSEPTENPNNFDLHIEANGHQQPHWVAWLKAF